MTELADPPAVVDVTDREAHATLLAQLGRGSSRIPPDLLVRQILAVVPASEWPTRVAALDALIRRLDAAHKDELRVESRPPRGRWLGPYTTRRKGSRSRPYHTVIRGVDPIEARCDCPDFVKNSLGACKHILTVLEAIHEKPRRLAQALSEQAAAARSTPTGLVWDPIRPLTGLGDWLERVTWRAAPEGPRRGFDAAQRRFRRRVGDGQLALASTHADDPIRRLALIEELQALLPETGDDPALSALFRHEHERLTRTVANQPRAGEIRAALRTLNRSLYPYQLDGVQRFLRAGRLLLADDMGLGKTAQAIASIHVLWQTIRVRRVLVIAPASLKPQWAREWAVFSDLPIHVVEGTPSERQQFYRDQTEAIAIINYEQLLRDLETVQSWAPDLVVLDEAQRIKNWATKTALSVKGLNPPYRLVLTGTPMENRVAELASIVEWVDDQAMEPKWRLPAFHAIFADGRRDVIGVRHLDTLRDRLRPAMVRRVRREVLDQLPPRTDTRVPVVMSEPQREEHDALIQPIAQILQRAARRPLTQAEFLRLMSLLTTQRIISNGLAQLNFTEVWPALARCAPEEGLLQGLSAPKLLELRQLIRQVVLEQGRKAVIFSQWRRMLALARWAVSDLLDSEALRAGFFTGAESTRRRTRNIVEFHDDPNFRLLFASDAGGVGLNLQRAANCAINLELPWNPAVLEQRIGRIYRLGQEQPIDVYNLVSETGIEARIAGLVGSKQAFFKGLFDGESDAIRFDQSSSFLARVERIYGEEAQAAGHDATEESIAEPDVDLDELSDAFEPLIDAADEATDTPTPDQDTPSSSPPPPTPPTRAEPAPRVDAIVPRGAALPGEVRTLFERLDVRHEPDGRLVIEAPPEVASTLTALFQGLAALLGSIAPTLSATETTAESPPRGPEAPSTGGEPAVTSSDGVRKTPR